MAFIGMNTYIITEGKNTKIFLKEGIMQLLLTVVTTYLLKNVDHGTEHDVLIMLMDFAYIRHSLNLQ